MWSYICYTPINGVHLCDSLIVTDMLHICPDLKNYQRGMLYVYLVLTHYFHPSFIQCTNPTYLSITSKYRGNRNCTIVHNRYLQSVHFTLLFIRSTDSLPRIYFHVYSHSGKVEKGLNTLMRSLHRKSKDGESIHDYAIISYISLSGAAFSPVTQSSLSRMLIEPPRQ